MTYPSFAFSDVQKPGGVSQNKTILVQPKEVSSPSFYDEIKAAISSLGNTTAFAEHKNTEQDAQIAALDRRVTALENKIVTTDDAKPTKKRKPSADVEKKPNRKNATANDAPKKRDVTTHAEKQKSLNLSNGSSFSIRGISEDVALLQDKSTEQITMYVKGQPINSMGKIWFIDAETKTVFLEGGEIH